MHINKDPDNFYITNACENDQNHLELFVDDKECLYVFDRGYVNYQRFDEMTDKGFFFVSRLRKNAVHRVIETIETNENQIISDQMIVIGTTLNRSENYFRRILPVFRCFQILNFRRKNYFRKFELYLCNASEIQ